MILIKGNPDNIGAMASILCLIHCIATPFIFIIHSCSKTCCSGVSSWWGFIDYFFLTISFFAVYHTVKTTSINWVKPFFWLSFLLLFIIIINEKTAWLYLDERLIYIPSIALITLHLYNKKHCKCNLDKCCTNEG